MKQEEVCNRWMQLEAVARWMGQARGERDGDNTSDLDVIIGGNQGYSTA